MVQILNGGQTCKGIACREFNGRGHGPAIAETVQKGWARKSAVSQWRSYHSLCSSSMSGMLKKRGAALDGW